MECVSSILNIDCDHQSSDHFKIPNKVTCIWIIWRLHILIKFPLNECYSLKPMISERNHLNNFTTAVYIDNLYSWPQGNTTLSKKYVGHISLYVKFNSILIVTIHIPSDAELQIISSLQNPWRFYVQVHCNLDHPTMGHQNREHSSMEER